MPSLASIIKHNYPYPLTREPQAEDSLHAKAAALLAELRAIATEFQDGKNGDYDRVRSDTSLSEKGKREKLRELQRVRIKRMELTIENSEVQSLITEGRSTLQSEHDEILAPAKYETVLAFLRGKEIRDHLATFADIPQGLSGDGQRFGEIENMIESDDAEGVNAIFSAPRTKPIIRDSKLLETLKTAWIEKQNPGLLGRMASLNELEAMTDQGIGDIRSGMEAAAGEIPSIRERIVEANPDPREAA